MMRTSVDVATAKPGPVPAELTVLAGKFREGLDQADSPLPQDEDRVRAFLQVRRQGLEP
jgi:hypothetical protein